MLLTILSVTGGHMFKMFNRSALFDFADFHVVPFNWYAIGTLPLFLGQLISAYEGIGCVSVIRGKPAICCRLCLHPK